MHKGEGRKIKVTKGRRKKSIGRGKNSEKD